MSTYYVHVHVVSTTGGNFLDRKPYGDSVIAFINRPVCIIAMCHSVVVTEMSRQIVTEMSHQMVTAELSQKQDMCGLKAPSLQ
jgi:hypothetical protein